MGHNNMKRTQTIGYGPLYAVNLAQRDINLLTDQVVLPHPAQGL